MPQQQHQAQTENGDQGAILRVIARMFRQHADLFLKQATYLEHMSLQCTNDFQSSSNLQDWANNFDQDMYNSTKTPTNNDISSKSSNIRLPPSREDIQEKRRRESVVDLAKKTYEGMKEVKSVVDVLLKNKSKNNVHKRRKFAYEIFQDDIMTLIVKEEGYKSLSWNEEEQAKYVFNRTQVEWNKLSTKKVKQYSLRAEGDEGIKHLKLNASLTSSTIPKGKRQKQQHNSSSNSTARKNGSKKRKLNQSDTPIEKEEKKKVQYRDNGDDDHDDNDSKTSMKVNGILSTKKDFNSDNDRDIYYENGSDDSESDSDSGSSTASVHNAENKNESSDDDDDDDRFDITTMPPIPLSNSTPLKRERDDDSSSSEEEDSDDNS